MSTAELRRSEANTEYYVKSLLKVSWISFDISGNRLHIYGRRVGIYDSKETQ
jgi:hypothetical protein